MMSLRQPHANDKRDQYGYEWFLLEQGQNFNISFKLNGHHGTKHICKMYTAAINIICVYFVPYYIQHFSRLAWA